MTAILTYLSGFTAKFWLALCAALLACLPVAYCQGRSDMHAKMQPKLALCEVKHGVTLSSLDKLEARLAAMIEAGETRAEAVADALAKSKRSTDGLRGEADVVRAAAVEACETPDVILEAGL